MQKSTNPIIVGAIAGSAATLVKEILGQVAVHNGLAPFDGIQKAAGMVVHPYEVRTTKGFATGMIMDLSIGITLGSIMAYLHNRRLVRMNAVTGSLVGLGAWAFWYGALGNKMSALGKTTPGGALVSAAWHLTYGAIAGALTNAVGMRQPAKTNQSVPTSSRRTAKIPRNTSSHYRMRGMW
jgi:hypothetical protein